MRQAQGRYYAGLAWGRRAGTAPVNATFLGTDTQTLLCVLLSLSKDMLEPSVSKSRQTKGQKEIEDDNGRSNGRGR